MRSGRGLFGCLHTYYTSVRRAATRAASRERERTTENAIIMPRTLSDSVLKRNCGAVTPEGAKTRAPTKKDESIYICEHGKYV